MQEWPPTIHLCLQSPCRITEETLVDGIEIRKARYRIKGLIHCRGEGDWSVSVERIALGGWHVLGKHSAPERQTDKEALLSGVMLIQLVKENTEGLTTESGQDRDEDADDVTQSRREVAATDASPAGSFDFRQETISTFQSWTHLTDHVTIPLSSGGARQDGHTSTRREIASRVDPIDLLTPRLTNGELKICALNSSFLVFLRVHPSIGSVLQRNRQSGDEDCLSFQIQKVLNSQDEQGQNLLGLKSFLNKKHPHTLAYHLGEKGGDALESFEHLVYDFIDETGGDQWAHYRTVTEDKDYPHICCGHDLTFSGYRKSFVFMQTANNTDGRVYSIQEKVDCYERDASKAGVKGATCRICSEVTAIQAVSTPQQMPELFAVSFAPHASTVRDVNSKISWGGSTYQTIAVIHHGDDHFWVSEMDNGHEEHWWRIDDYCDREDTWRRRYLDGAGGMATRPDGGLTVHKLNEKVGLLVLKKTDAVEANQMQVSARQNILLGKY